MPFVRAKHARSSDYIYSKKRASLSIFVSTVLLVTTVSPASLAIDFNNSAVAIPALCDPSTLPLPISPSPTVSISPTPQPEVSLTPESIPAPTPSEGVEPVAELISEDYVEPVIPAGESSATVSKSEPTTSPKVICPSPVTNVFARPQNTQLEISWTPGVSAEPNTIENITDYYVKVLETAQVIKVSADRTSTTISGLTNGASYSIIVYAASEYGSSIASELVTAIPLSGNEGEVAGIIVEFKPEANVEQGQLDVPGEELVTQVELTIENKITEDVHVVEFSEATTLEEAKTIANEISQDPQVVWAEPDQFVYTSAQEVINDPNYSTDQWNLWDKYGIGIGQTNKEMTTAWSLTAGQGINVAVIDTGIASHPDLDSQVISGFDFVSDPEFLKASREENGPQVSFDGDYINSEKYGSLGWDDNPQDPGDWRGVGPVRNSTWHGTHIAGVIAAQSENQEGIAGIAPGAKIQPIRALSWRGGLLSDIASSITWASGGSVTGVADNPTPAKVINMSFSVNSVCPTSLQTAINDAFARGSVLVAAAGNNNDDVKNYAPANCENVISVGASNKDGKRASYSNYGLGLDVSAPGGDANDNGIYSTANAGLTEPASFSYASQQGTSISAAHVSAIAARIFSSNPTFNPTDVKSQITNKESVREFADTQCDIDADIYCGEGIVSLFQVANTSFLNAPTVSSVTVSGTQITMNFSAPTYTGTITGYIVQYSTNGTTWTTASDSIASNATSYTITGLSASTSYYTRVAAKHSGGVGTYGYKWQKIYETTTPYRTSDLITYTSGFGLGGSDAAVTYASTNFSRVRYEMAARYGGTNNYVYADFAKRLYPATASSEEFSITNLRIPTLSGASSQFEIHGQVSDLNILSNVGEVETGNGFSGILEIWPWNYGVATSLSAGSSSTFDHDDTPAGNSIYGSFQLHRYSSSDTSKNKTIFAWNKHFDNLNYEIGFGNAPAGSNPDWTFTNNGNTRTNFSLGIFIDPPVATTIAAPTIANATISGTQKIGSTLTGSAGTTTGTVSSTTYQWQYSANGSSWTNIPTSGTSPNYAISGTTYRGNYLRVGVTVTNASGSATAYSDPTALIYYPDCSPTTSTPTVNGVLRNLYSFTTVGTCDWSVPDGVSFADLLVVGGGGGAGGAHDNASSGGGGAGYVYANSSQSISGKILITVGAGGTGGIGVSLGTFQNGNAGADSVFGSVTALGGAGGLGGYESFSGGVCPTYTIPIKGGTAATLIQRAAGGQDGCNTRSGFGGGGQNSTQSQTGGTGLASSITGSSTTYGTGGAGGTRFSNTSPAAQSSGTGNGGTGANAASSTGRTGGAGGSGIVIVSAVAASPTITAITPSTGSVTAGGSVTITGTNFVSGQTTVTINGVSLTSVSVSSSTTLTATLPTLTVGTHDLVVNNGRASATSAGAFTVLAAPTIASASITGTNVVGETLTATANTVTGTSVTTTYQWQSCASSCTTLSNFSNISGATSSTYVLTSSEASKLIRVIITVTNAGGTASATSSATTVILNSCSSTITTPTINGVVRTVRQITTTGTCYWVPPSNVTKIDLLVIGGGGGAGSRGAGGGGAGGFVEANSYSVTPGSSYEIVVGTGGAGAAASTGNSGTAGVASSFKLSGTGITANGGGAGLSHTTTGGGGNAGSGSGTGGTAFNFNGGNGAQTTCGTSDWCGGGGGGAGSLGSNAGSTGGNGGNGRASSITGISTTYAGGGGGGGGSSGTPSSTPTAGGTGGTGGGGAGATSTFTTGCFVANGTNGTNGLGGGGGGGTYCDVFSSPDSSGSGGTGGSGIVIVSYASAPIVSSISPTSGGITGAVSVTITGENFITGSTVTIGGVSLTSVSVVSGTSITGTISADSLTAGTKDVVVTTSSGTSTGGTGLYEGVNKSTPSLASISNISKTYGDSTFSISTPTATVSGSTIAGAVSYASSNTSVVSVSGSTATVVGVGTATFTATFTPTNTSLYNTTTTTFTITVAAKALTITADAKSKSFGETTPTNSYTLSTTLVGSDAISSLTYTYSGTNTITAPTAVGSYTITPSSVSFSTGSTSNYSITYAAGTYTIGLATQATLTVSSTSGTFGSALTLTTSGGTSGGSVTYVATTGTATSCTVSGDSLTAGSAGTCFVTATKAADSQYSSISSTSTTVTFAKANQSALTIDSAATVAFGSTLTLSTTGGSGTGSVTYSKTGTCTISGSTLTPGDAGSSCVVTATKALDTNYNAISSATQTITITKINQSALTIDSASTVAFGSTLSLSTTGGSGTGSVTYSKTGTCTISSSTLTPGDAGSSCVITATKALDTNYNAISSATQTITITKINQSALTISSTSGTFGSALTLTTSGGSTAGSVTYSVSDGTASTCAISSGSLSVASAGTCLVTATMAGNTNYNAVVSTQTTITFAKASQSSLTVTSTSGTYGSTLTLTTSGGSGDGAVTYVATPGTASSCTVSGSTLTAGSGGTCLVTATKATSTNYLAVSSSQTTVSFGNQSVSLSGFSDISSKNYGDTTFTLTAPTVAGSVAGAFTYSSETTSVATISGSTVTIVGAGTSTITATFTPTDTGRYSSQTITMLLTVNKKAITVTAVDKTKVYAQSTPTNSFTNSTLVGSDAISSLTYTYSGTNSTSAPTTVGNYTITPSSASFSTGSINNYTITYVPAAYSITKATPAFTGFNNVSKTYGDSSFTITAPTVTGSISGSFAYSSSDTSAITISSATATVAGTGSSLITASFTPTDTTNYNSATTTMTISVAKATQSSLSITSASSVNYGSTISLTSSGGSGTGAISFAVTSGTCSISSTTLTPANAGSTCVIQATKALDTNYNVATSSTQTITINKINQTVSFTSTAPSSPVSGDTYTPLASATSGVSPTISIASSSSSVCSLSAGIVTFNTSGTCLIEADSASSTNYNAALTASQSITVAKITQTITFALPTGSNFGDSNRTMSASTTSGLAITYSEGADTTNSACTVSSSGVVAILAVGNCQVTASQSGNDQYDAAGAVSRTFAVSAIVPSAPFLTSVSAGNASATVSFTAPSSNGGATLSAYEVVAIPSSGSTVTKSNCSTSASPLACTITDLTNGTSYTFKVAAINSAGTSAYSTTSGSFTPATIANSVVNLVAQPGDGSLIVSWDQPTDLGGGTFTRYDIYYKSTSSYPGTPNKQINTDTSTTWTFTGLTNGTSYDVKVVAITSANASELSGNTAEVSQYPSTAPSAPTSVTVSKLTGTSARISWGLPLTDGGASLDATTPYVATITGGPSPITCGALSGRTCDITGLTPATTYSVSVVAQNRMGAGTAGTATYLVPSNDANLLSFDLKTGATLSDPSPATYSPSFSASTTSYSVTVANTQAYARITPTVNELTATIKINGVTVSSGVARNLSLGIGANVFTVEVTAGDLTTTKTYTLTVTRPKASQMPISITSASTVNYGDTITLTTTGGSGTGLVSFATTGTCTTAFSGGSYILTPGDAASSCSITATKATDDDYFAASTSSQTITISKTTPTLSGFTNISKTYGDPSFTINDPNVSGSAPGTFTYASSNTSVASISGSTVTVEGFGTSTITATFVPTSSTNYNSTTTSLVISVGKKALRVTPSDKTKFYGASHPTITKSVIGLAGSDDISTISYTYEGTGSTSYSASTTNPENVGTYSITPAITALTSGSLNNYNITYDAATLTISKVSQSGLTIVSSSSATYGVNLTLSTSGGSGSGSVTFTKVSGDCTLNNSGSTFSITPGDAGNTCVVNATKAADTNYNLASTTDQTITIGKAVQTLAFTSTPSSSKVNDTYTPVVTSKHSSTAVSTGITPSMTIDSASSSVCSIATGVITFDAVGSCVINADAISSTNYEVATTTSQTITVTVVVTNSNSNSDSNSRANSTPVPTPSAGVRPNAQRPVIRNVVETPPNRPITPPGLTNLPPVDRPELRPIFPSRSESVLPNSSNPGLAITDNIGRLPKSEPGEKQISVGGNFLPIVEFITPEGNTGFTIPESTNVAPIEVVLKTTDIEGQNIPASDDGILRAVKGQTITVSGEGLTPGSTYSAWLFSEPTKLGEGKVGADSKFEKVFFVPQDLATGEHTLQINGINSDKKVVSLTTGVILTDVRVIQNVRESDARLVAWAIIFIFILLFIIGFLLKYIRRLQTRLL